MKHKPGRIGTRWKVGGLALAFLAGGVLLIVLSSLVMRSAESPGSSGSGAAGAPAGSQPVSTMPAEERPTRSPPDPRQAAAQGMSGLLLLLGLAGVGFSAICAGWVVYDVYRSRPAWKTQTKFPKRR